MRARVVIGSIIAGVIGFLLVFLVGRALFGGDGNDHPHIGEGEATVEDVVGRAPRGHTVVVRGYVFIDSTDRVLLCSARHPGTVPSCAGHAIIATGVDENRLDLVTGTALSGNPLRWTRDTVALQGTWTITLAVTDVLR